MVPPRVMRSALAAAGVVALVGAGLVVRAWHRPLAAPPIVVTAAYRQYADTLKRDQTLGDLLQRAGITGRAYGALLAAAHVLDARRLRPGLVFQFRRPVTDSVADQIGVRTGPEQRIWLMRVGAAWLEKVETIAWSTTRVRITGNVTDNLYDGLDRAVPDSVLPAAQRVALAWAIADVYDWEVDFTRDVRAGDRVDVLFERLESPTGERRFGRILAARVDAGRSSNYAFRFAGVDSARAGYYDETGRSLRRAFLRAPLAFRRISSGFGNRYHPILHRWRKHEGIDFSAAYGTPVRATADGVVIKLTYEADGYGRMIELRHANGIKTIYGHLSAYAKGLHTGQRVSQSETIGFVGSTGLSTGPHLHYEFLVNGQATNPQRKDMGAGQPVPKALKDQFDAIRGTLQTLLEPPPVANVASAGD
ncbi:MAG TPA: M23 family metallopeptidase [Gemmatimonadales bacterium]|jgi:murein DD-endopeptidase MepM/ murein hydrolase activator NlpD|nr:M23 family metallopeptidase [Gemmatimonadales bacterium]